MRLQVGVLVHALSLLVVWAIQTCHASPVHLFWALSLCAFPLMLQKLEHKVSVLNQKVESDARLHRQTAAAAAKERSSLEQQVSRSSSGGRGRDRDSSRSKGSNLKGQQ